MSWSARRREQGKDTLCFSDLHRPSECAGGRGDLKEELYLLYVSPLKSLAGDIRENLRRPLDGIPKKAGQPEIVAAMRTGDTPQKERQRMIKHPPHILIHNAGITLSDADVKGRAGNTQDGESGYPG